MVTELIAASGYDAHNSIVLKLDQQQYLARLHKTVLEGLSDVDEQTLATAIRIEPGAKIDRDALERIVESYCRSDDVFHRACLRAIIFVGAARTEIEVSRDAMHVMREWGTIWTKYISGQSTDHDLPGGPYLVDQRGLSKLYKVYDDTNHAFTAACVPTLDGDLAWEDIRLAGTSYSCLGIAVPSRQYFQPEAQLPLNGLRIAVKDVYHMRGLKTSVCNRAYESLYPKQENTARCLRRLVECGAQLVGKTHLSSFAWREEPTECVDYQAPFNPRGDGYQSPAGSSSGSGAAIATYDWLDFTIGTDTTGSGRRPALWNGCFALRPSAGTLPQGGMVPTCPKFDIPSFFGRDIGTFTTLMKAWFDRPLRPTTDASKPWTVVYPVDYMDIITNAEQLAHLDKFTRELGQFLNAEVKRISVAEQWEITGVSPEPLHTFMSWVQEHGFYYDAYHCFDDFRELYETRRACRPYISPPTEWMWGIAALISEAQRDEAMRRFTIFRDWFLQHILHVGTQNTLVILPIENLEPRYRDVPPPPAPTRPPKGMSVLFLSPTLGAPELVVPVGHAVYRSRITDRKERLPVAVSVLAAPDMDFHLVDLVERFLQASHRPTRVNTGRTMF